MKEKISVIIPAYNAEPFLERCIGSIRSQTYDHLEILIVSNGSTDRTVEMAKQMADTDARIRVFQGINEGVSAARNSGIEQATGDYLTFVDADDWICPDMLETLYRALKTHDCDVAGCSFLATDGKVSEETANVRAEFENDTEHISQARDIEVVSGTEFIEKRIFDGDSRCWSKLYSRAAIGETRFQKGLTIGEDMLFVLAVMQKNVKFADVDYRGYCYYLNPNGAMETAFKSSYMDQITCWQEAKKRVTAPSAALTDKIHRVILIAVMLVAGKLALARGLTRGEKKGYIAGCTQTIEAFEKAEYQRAYRLLSKGYQLRVSLFRHLPNTYLFLWKILKKIHAI